MLMVQLNHLLNSIPPHSTNLGFIYVRTSRFDIASLPSSRPIMNACDNGRIRESTHVTISNVEINERL